MAKKRPHVRKTKKSIAAASTRTAEHRKLCRPLFGRVAAAPKRPGTFGPRVRETKETRR